MDPVWDEKVPSLEGCRAAAGWVCNAGLQHFCGELNSPENFGGRLGSYVMGGDVSK